MRIQPIVDRFKAFGRAVQAGFVRVALVVIYFFGFGMARLWASLFHRRLLSPPDHSSGSLWLPAPDQAFDEEGSFHQS